ncbi:MAG: hypothetical protein ACK4YP_14120 [Myxococcota bacterium]
MRPSFLALALLLAACGPDHGIAGACRDDADCPTGECYTGTDPGYCTAACESEGSTAECPEYTVCKRIQGGEASCLLLCEDDHHCPANAECNEIPDSDGLRGCEPVL